MPRLDVRETPPPQRHSTIFETFDEMECGETLELVNDHDPRPLFYQMREEVDAFDADGYRVEKRGPEEYVAHFPKQ